MTTSKNTIEEVSARRFARAAIGYLSVVALLGFLGGTLALSAQIDEEVLEQAAAVRAGALSGEGGGAGAVDGDALARFLEGLAAMEDEISLAFVARGAGAEAIAVGDPRLMSELEDVTESLAPGQARSLGRGRRATVVELEGRTRVFVALDGGGWLDRVRTLGLLLVGFVAAGALLAFLFGRAFGASVARAVRAVGQGPEPLADAPRELQVLDAAVRAAGAERDRSRVLSAGLAHDVRGPIQSLLTRTQVSLDDPATPDAARAVLRENQRALRRLARTVDNVVAWTIPRPPGGGPGPVDACEALAGRLVAEEAGAADKGVFFDAERRGLCPVALDAEELVLAVRNLVSNAIAWTPPGGAVTLVVERECEGGAVRVVVDDDGPGVPEDAYAEIFSPFRKRGEHAGAYGLGLALVRAIAERAGGAVEVRRSPSGGARFTLTLPAAAGGRRAE